MTRRVCSGTELKFFYASGDKQQFRYYRCGNCGLVNLDMDGVGIYDNQRKYFNRSVPPADYEREKEAEDACRFIKRYVPLKGRYLDIGCGSGGILCFARKEGWDVKGLEISDDYAKHVKERLGIEVETANFLEYENPREKYELVSLIHVLEHLPDSVLTMNKISGLLVDRGYGPLKNLFHTRIHIGTKARAIIRKR
jgi:2-polyprenyl-3-methyl-5-hydroxy-6-metoxy-1,4-benzoquinol methylase